MMNDLLTDLEGAILVTFPELIRLAASDRKAFLHEANLALDSLVSIQQLRQGTAPTNKTRKASPTG